MKKLIVASMLVALPLLGALSPSMYRKAQARSSDVLTIKVQKVRTYRYRNNYFDVRVRARVLSVQRASRWIHRGDWITIRYRTYHRLPRGTFGAGPIPLLQKGHRYRAYLKRYRHSRIYTPAAGARSFKTLHRKVRF